MSNRIVSIKVMQYMNCYLQAGCLSAKEVSVAVSEFQRGDSEKLRELINRPEIPCELLHISNELRKLI